MKDEELLRQRSGTPAGALSPETTSAAGQTLSGTLGTASIFFSVVAWAAPLLVVVGLMPSMIGFAGYGVVAGFGVTTIILLFFAVGYTTLTRYVDRPGAFYAYITSGLGKAVGLGGAYLATFGYLFLVLATWVAFGVFGSQLVADTFNGPQIPWFVISAIGIVAAAVLSHFSIEVSAKTLTVALALEVVLVLVFNAFVFADGGPNGPATEPFTVSAIDGGGFGLALLYAVLCFIGFESSAIYREEARDPYRTIPRATYLAVVSIGVFYMLASWAMVTALGTEGVAGAATADISTMFDDLASTYVGSVVPDIVTVLVVTSNFACILASRNATARYGYSLGRDGVLPAKLGVAHPTHRSPYVASSVVTALEVISLVVIAALTGFDGAGERALTVYVRMAGIGTVAVLLLMCIVSVAVIAFTWRRPEIRAGQVLRTVVAPVLGFVGLSSIFVLALQNISGLVGASVGTSMLLVAILPLIVLAGVGQAVWLRRNRPDVHARIGRQ